MSAVSTLTKLAQKLGYDSVELAEKSLGKEGWSRAMRLDSEAATQVIPASTSGFQKFTEAARSPDRDPHWGMTGQEEQASFRKRDAVRDDTAINRPGALDAPDTPNLNGLAKQVGLTTGAAGAAALGTASAQGRSGDYSEKWNFPGSIERPNKAASAAPTESAPSAPPPTGEAGEKQKQPTPPSDSALKKAISSYEGAFRSLNKQGVDTSGIEQELVDARAEYKQAKDTNEKLELAQLIMNAMAKWAAAAEGKKQGRVIDTSLPDIDYSKRTAGERDMYGLRLREIDTRRASAQSQDKERYDRDLDGAKSLSSRVQAERDLYGDRTSQYRAELSEGKSEKAATARNDATNLSAERRWGKEEYNRMDEVEGNLLKQSTALGNWETALSKGDSKGIAAAEKELIKAKIPGEKLQEARDVATKDTWFGEDKKAKAKYVSSLLDGLKEQIAAAKQRKEEAGIVSRQGLKGLPAADNSPASPVGGTLPDLRLGERSPPVLSPEDEQALNWANKNPNDPRAAEIRKRLGK